MSSVPEPRRGDPAAAEVPRGLETGERQALLARVKQLEAEVERYRIHAERTSKIVQSVTNYAEWVKEGARRDAEIALRKASARVAKLDGMVRDLGKTELELVRAQEELARLQALADETRARLSTFLAAGIEVLNSTQAPDDASAPSASLEELDDALREQLGSAATTRRVEEPAGPEA
jgi:hypothetical protein